jgi:hypothetical protein
MMNKLHRWPLMFLVIFPLTWINGLIKVVSTGEHKWVIVVSRFTASTVKKICEVLALVVAALAYPKHVMSARNWHLAWEVRNYTSGVPRHSNGNSKQHNRNVLTSFRYMLWRSGHACNLGEGQGGANAPPQYFFNLGIVYLFTDLNNDK